MKALERPTYLTKLPDVKVWEVHVERGYEVSINRFYNVKQAAKFARDNKVTFYPNKFYWEKAN